MDQTLRLWDVANPSGLDTGQCLKTLKGHTNVVWSVAFRSVHEGHPQTLASSSADEAIKLWDIQSGVCLKTLRSDRPYERMNITEVMGLTEVQKGALQILGAVEGS